MKKTIQCLAVTLLAITACTEATEAGSTMAPDPTLQGSSTPTTSPPPSTVGTTLPGTTTTLGNSNSSNLHISGSTLVYSVDGQVLIRGWVESPVDVSVAGTPAPIDDDGIFEVELRLEPGEHQVAIVAVDDYGAEETATIQVEVDPGLELQFAYVIDIDPENGEIVADYAEWLTGDEAVAAAIEDGEQVDPGGLPGDFYIRNRNPRLRTLPLASDAVIVLLAGVDEALFPPRSQVGIDIWSLLMADPEAAYDAHGMWWYGSGGLPYWLTLDSGEQVLQVEEHYLP